MGRLWDILKGERALLESDECTMHLTGSAFLVSLEAFGICSDWV